jgi:hypothetical protein
MKRMLKGFLSFALLLTGATVGADDNNSSIFGIPFFAHRPQGDDLARRMVGEVHYLTRCDTECLSGSFSAALEYTRTFNAKKIADALTFNGQETMVFRAPTDNTTAAGDVNPENFLLASNFVGNITFRPRVENMIIDLNLRLNLDEWLCGLYFEIGLPINWTRWDLRFEESPVNPGTVINAGVVNGEVTAPVSSIIEAWKGQATAGRVLEKMNKAVVDGRQHKTSVADIEFVLGYNIWCTDCGHFGVNLRVAAPTGTRPDGDFFFEPIVGNGKHTQVGAGITGHYVIWENDCDQSFSVWFEGEVHHLFRAKQHRTFDLIGNGPGSRYLLLKRFTDATTSANEVVRGPNVLTREVDVRIGAAGEAVILFNYQRCGFSVDFGYNVWGRTKEKIKLRGDDIPANTYAVKGHTAAAAPTTASTTRINGVNADTTDANPVFITNDSLDLDSAANPSAVSHKFFGHFGYAWEDCDYAPFVGVGGFGEWSGRKNRAFNQAGVWVKGGFAFS